LGEESRSRSKSAIDVGAESGVALAVVFDFVGAEVSAIFSSSSSSSSETSAGASSTSLPSQSNPPATANVGSLLVEASGAYVSRDTISGRLQRRKPDCQLTSDSISESSS
jgi:hypothetical protein